MTQQPDEKVRLADLELTVFRCLSELRGFAEDAGAAYRLRAVVKIGQQSVEIGISSNRCGIDAETPRFEAGKRCTHGVLYSDHCKECARNGRYDNAGWPER